MQTRTDLNQITVRFGHSPDPDDAFMFYAIAYDKIPMDGFQITHVVEDIESLNKRALRAELEVTAVSVHAFSYLSNQYAILRSGASIGDKYGPMIVARTHFKPSELRGKKIAIPGELTTANLVLKLFEQKFIPEIVPFDQIMDYVLSGKADAGLIIHEGQITFREKGLCKVIDLGEWWWEETGLPLPLGVDVIRKDMGLDVMKRFGAVFKNSILYALENRTPALEYAIRFGRGLKPDLNDQFVGMYVNDYTVDLGDKGEQAIQKIFDLGLKKGILAKEVSIQFV